MKKKYDLMSEPWIPVVDLEGNRLQLGIRNVLLKAHTLREVSDASPLIEYGLYRFLITLTMDAFRPETIDDIEDLLETGQFSEDAIRDYELVCLNEGVSFDLFDENRPFLQATPNAQWDGKKKPAVYLDCTIPTGNNHTHFDHLGKTSGLSFPRAAAKLIPCSLFATARLKEYPSSINAAPPYFTVIKGKNLFETLAHQMVPLEEIECFDEPPVLWRSDMVVEPKKQITTTSWLYGMLFPARRIRLLPNWDTMTVDEIYFGQGMNFCEAGNWLDHYVTYRVGKEGRFPWRPNGEKAVWQNLCDLIDTSGKHAPVSVQLFQRIHGRKPVMMNISLYGVQTNQASYTQVFSYDLQLPIFLMRDEQRISFVREMIGQTEETVRRLRYSLTYKDVPANVVSQTVQQFLQRSEISFWEEIGTRLSQDDVDIDECAKRWTGNLKRSAMKSVDEAFNSLQLHSKAWIALYAQQNTLVKYLNAL